MIRIENQFSIGCVCFVAFWLLMWRIEVAIVVFIENVFVLCVLYVFYVAVVYGYSSSSELMCVKNKEKEPK